MPTFPSKEWMEEFCVRVREHPEAAEVAPSLEGVYRFVVEPAGPLSEKQVYELEVVAGADGQPGVAPLAGFEGRPRLTVAADYQRWRQLIDGQLDIGLAVMLRRVRVSGDIGALTRGISNTRPLLDAISSVPTTWLEEQ